MNKINTFAIPASHNKEPQGLTEADIHRLFGTMTKAKTKAILQTLRTYCELVVSLPQQQETEIMQEIQIKPKANKTMTLLPVKQAA